MPIQIPTVQTGLEASIQAAAQKAGRNLKINLGANSKSIESLAQPLGRITGKADEFTKSMEAANARVLAFGASVGVLSAITRGFRELVKTTVEVEKSLANINSILNVSAGQLDKFKKEIFDVARNTEQTFDTVAQAALELSRQGLKAEEVTKRLNDSMILARLSGLGAAEAVSGLTAAINSFNSQGLTSAEVLNKIAAAAVKAAVSEKDLIEGIKRSGAVAIEAGVTFDELVGVISALQQQTARGGSVIGNSLKTIFTRLQSLEKLKTMQDLGVEITDAAGEILPATKLIQNLGQAIQTLPDTRKLQIAENLVGKFQIAPFLAILRDYNSETQIAIDITRVAANATTEAYGRNVTLNKTLSAAINEATTNLKELANTLGEIGVTESLQNVLGFFNSLVTKIQEVLEGEGVGSEFARGLVKGIGNVISGPGLAIFGAIIAKLTIDLTRFGAASLQTFFGLNKTAKDIAATQGSIASTLLKNSDIQKQILAIENSTLSVEQKRAAQTQFFTQALNSQLAVMKQMQGIAASIAPSVVARTRGSTGRGRAAGGFIPNFDAVRGYGSEQQDIMRGVGGAPSSARPVTIPNFNFGGGQRGTMVANSSEFIVPNYAGGGSAIYNQDMVRSMGMPAGARSLAAGGYIPNFSTFAVQLSKNFAFRSHGQLRQGQEGQKVNLQPTQLAAAIKSGAVAKGNIPAGYKGAASKTAKTPKTAGPKIPGPEVQRTIDIQKAFGGQKLPTILTPRGGQGFVSMAPEITNMVPDWPGSIKGKYTWERRGMKAGSPLMKKFRRQFRRVKVKELADRMVLPLATEVARTVGAPPVEPSTVDRVKNVKGFVSSAYAAMGGIFDAAIATGLNLESKDVDGGDFDFRGPTERPEAFGWMTQLFGRGFAGQGTFKGLADLKFAASDTAKKSMLGKTNKEIRLTPDRMAKLRAAAIPKLPPIKQKGGKGAAGYIPNFDATRGYALEDAIGREKAAGLPISQIRVNQDARLRNAGNPMGLAVTNMRDEPTGSIAARGYVPSYAKPAAGGAGGADGAGKLNQGFDSTLNKLFMFQIAMGVLTGFTSELSNENKTLAKSMKLLNLAVTAAMIGSMTKGGVGGLGRFLTGRTGMNMRSTAMRSQGLQMPGSAGMRAARLGRIGGAATAGLGIGVAAVAAGQIFRMFQEPSKQAGKDLSVLSVMAAEAATNLSKMDRALSEEGAGTTGSGFMGSVGDFVQNTGTSLIQGLTSPFGTFGDKRLMTSASRMNAEGERVDLELLGVNAEQFKAAEIGVRQAFLAANPDLRTADGEMMNAEQRNKEAQKFFEENVMVGGDLFTDDSVKNARVMVSILGKMAKSKKDVLNLEQIQNKIEKVRLRDAQQRLSLMVEIKKAQEGRTTETQKQIQAAKILGNVGQKELRNLEEKNKLEELDLKFVQDRRDSIIKLIKESGNLVASKHQEEAVRKVLNNLTKDELKDQVKLRKVLEEALRLTNAQEIGGKELVTLGENMVETALKEGKAKSDIHDITRRDIVANGTRIGQLEDQVELARDIANELERAARVTAFDRAFDLTQQADTLEVKKARVGARDTRGSAIAERRKALRQARLDREQIGIDAGIDREEARVRAQEAGVAAIGDLGVNEEATQTAALRSFMSDIEKAGSAKEQRDALFFLQQDLQKGRFGGDIDDQKMKAFERAIQKATDEVNENERDLERSSKKRNKLIDILENEIRKRNRLITAEEKMLSAIEKLPQRLEDLRFESLTDPTQSGRDRATFQREQARAAMVRADLDPNLDLSTRKGRRQFSRLDENVQAQLLRDINAGQQLLGASIDDLRSFDPNQDLELVNKNLKQSIVDLELQIKQATSPSGAAALAFDRDTARQMLNARNAAAAAGEDPIAAQAAVARTRVNRGLGQTFAESSILNASDEERAQRMNELLRDGSVEFANNIGTAMHKAIRDGESFSDGLRNAGLSFLDYISEAMMQMAAQQVVGQFTGGMFTQGGASKTGGASAGGGFGSRLAGMFSGGGGGGGNVTGAAVVGGNFGSGGLIIGGSGKRDDVPAMLTGGEFVMSRGAVSSYGVGFMKQLNDRRVAGFANGGLVGDLFDPAYSGRALRGKSQLMGFARQGVTSGAGDFIRGGSGGGGAFGAVALQPGSIRGTQFQRRTDLMSKRRTESRKNALNLYFQQLQSEDQRQKAWDAEQERLLRERLFKAEQERKAKAAEKARREAEKRARRSTIGSFIGMALGSFLGPMGAAAGSMIGGSIGGSMATGGYAQGGLFGMLGLGQLPSIQKMRANMEKRGREAGYSPSNPAPRTRGGLLGGVIGQAAGVDTVPTMLSGGEFVMNAAATRRIGRSNLADLNSGVGGASGGSSSALIGAIGQLVGAQSQGGSGNNISITINQDGTQSTSMGGNTSRSAQSLASRIRDAVTEIIAEEKRLGGVLRTA